MLNVQLLGTISVLKNGEPVDLPGHQSRALLSYLALRPSAARHFDGIIDALWPDRLPRDPRQAVHTHASRLRAVLGQDTIVARDGGYALHIEGDQIDASRFESLVHAASDPGCSTRRRADLLGSALALWRGQPLEGFGDQPWAVADVARLNELRASAVDDWSECMTSLGLAEKAIPELEAAVHREPLREHTHALLVTALADGARHAEGLRVAARFRRHLRDELGLEPSPDFTTLESEVASGRPIVRRRITENRGWDIQERIGDGHHAVVYRGTQSALGRDVAIKVVHGAIADRPDFVRRFEAEHEILANLEHPHVVPILDYWREPGTARIVMRLFRSGSLHNAIGRGPIDFDDVSRLVSQIGGALKAAHREGIVHGSVKPSNVFLDDEGNYFIGDFFVNTFSTVSRVAPAGPGGDVRGLASLALCCLEDASNPGGEATRARAGESRTTSSVLQFLNRILGLQDEAEDFAQDISITDFVAEFSNAAKRGTTQATRYDRRAFRNPYKGLLAFHEADASDFFGRDRAVDQLLAKFTTDNNNNTDNNNTDNNTDNNDGNSNGNNTGLVAVIGPSGSGKSSLVRAGLLPRLRAGAITDSETWFVTTMIPGEQPFEELEIALRRISSNPVVGLAVTMAADVGGIARGIQQVMADRASELVIVIDQFEELYTRCTNAEMRRFVEGLLAALRLPALALRVVLTLRADYYDRPLQHPGLAEALSGSTVVVTPLHSEELEAAITQPAARVGVTFEVGLATRIVAEVVDQPGALPMLQYALTQLFDRRVGRHMTHRAYDEIGGLAGAVARRAEDLYADLTDSDKAVIGKYFSRLVTIHDGSEETRRRVRRSEFGPSGELDAVVARFGAERLLAFDRDPVTREPTIEVAHEALIREWPRLRSWIEENRETLRIRQHLSDAANAWTIVGRDDGELYRGARLDAALDWQDRHRDDASEIENEFLDASNQHQNEVTEAKERHTAELEQLVQELHEEHHRLEQSRAYAETSRLALQATSMVGTDRSLALLLAVEAARRGDTTETRSALQRALRGSGPILRFFETISSVIAVDWEATGHFVVATATSLIRLDERGVVVERAELPISATDSSHCFQFSEDLAGWIGVDGGAYIAPVRNLANAYRIKGRAVSLSISAATRRVAVVRPDRALDLFDLNTGSLLWTVPGHPALTQGELRSALGLASIKVGGAQDHPLKIGFVVFADNARQLVRTQALLVETFDATSGALLSSSSHGAFVLVRPGSVSHGDGNGNRDRDREVDLLGRDAVHRLTIDGVSPMQSFMIENRFGLEDTPADIARLPNGRAAVLRASGTLSLLDPGSAIGQSTEIVLPIGRATCVRASADGRTVVAGGASGLVVVAVDGSGLLHRAIPRPRGYSYLMGGRDGDWVAAECDPDAPTRPGGRMWHLEKDGSHTDVTRFDLVTTTIALVDNIRPDVIGRYRFDPPGGGHTLELFDAGDGSPLSGVLRKGIGSQGSAFDPNGQWFITDNYVPKDIQVLRANDGVELARFPVDEPGVGGVQFAVTAAGDRILVTGLATGRSRIIDTATWEIAPSVLPTGAAQLAMFSPDGRYVVTQAIHGQMTLRDSVTFTEVRHFSSSTGASATFNMQHTAFSDCGRFLVTVHDGRGRIWDVATGSLIGDPFDSARKIVPCALRGERVGLLTGDDDHIQVWRFDVDGWRELATEAAGRNMTRAEWKQYGPSDEPYRATSSRWSLRE